MSNTAREQIHHSKHIVFDSYSFRGGDEKKQWDDSEGRDPADVIINFGNSDFTSGQIVSLLPVDITIPNLFNNVTAANNQIEIIDAMAQATITMPIGHYTVTEWCTEFTAQVAASALLVSVISCEVNTITGQLTILMDGAWLITENPPSTTSGGLFRLLGLDPAQSPLTSIGNAITGANPPAFQGPQCVVIHTNITASNTVLGGNQQQFTMLEFVSLADTCFGASKHHFVRTDNVREIPFPAPQNLNTMRLTLFDIDGTRLTLPSNAKVCYHFIVSFGRDF